MTPEESGASSFGVTVATAHPQSALARSMRRIRLPALRSANRAVLISPCISVSRSARRDVNSRRGAGGAATAVIAEKKQEKAAKRSFTILPPSSLDLGLLRPL